MTKREEIREGIALRLHTRERSLLKVVYEVSPCNCTWEELSGINKGYYREDAEWLMKYLHSQGVVIESKVSLQGIKIPPEVPIPIWAKCRDARYRAGFRRTQPLIGE